MIPNEVLKSDIALFMFLSLSALLGWVYPYVGKTLVKKYSPLTLSIIDALVVVTTLLVGALFVEKENFLISGSHSVSTYHLTDLHLF